MSVDLSVMKDKRLESILPALTSLAVASAVWISISSRVPCLLTMRRACSIVRRNFSSSTCGLGGGPIWVSGRTKGRCGRLFP